jgi:Tfp pilus assembly protein PilO
MNIEFMGKTINARYITHTRRYVLFAVGLVLLSIFLTMVIIVPQGQAALDRYDELKRQQAQLDKLKIKVQQLQALPESELFSNSWRINQLLPSKKPLLELLTAMNLVAGEAGVVYSDISLSPGKIATAGADLTERVPVAGSRNQQPSRGSAGGSARGPISGVESLNIRLKVAGNLENINLFLSQIESVAPLTTVTRLSLVERAASRVNPESFFEAEMEVESYFFNQIISASVAAPIPSLSVTQQVILNEIANYRYPDVQRRDVIQGGVIDPFRVDDSGFILSL